MSEEVQQMVSEMAENLAKMVVAQAVKLKTPEAREALIVSLLKTHVELGRFLERYDREHESGRGLRGVPLGTLFAGEGVKDALQHQEVGDG